LLRPMPAIEFVGIYDTNPARAAEVARRLETVDHPSLEALLERVDAVTVAVPTPAHAAVGMAVLERGIALLMEKPLADTVAAADQLVRRAGDRGVVLQVGHVERFNRAVRAAAPTWRSRASCRSTASRRSSRAGPMWPSSSIS